MGRGKGRAAPKKTYKQTPIRNILPTLHRPASAIGRQIKVPGSYWEGRMSEAEKQTMYTCNVLEFDAAHKFDNLDRQAAFLVKEMGVDGRGSLEIVEAEPFWVKYPSRFLEFFYAANPDDLPEALRPEPEVTEGCSRISDVGDGESETKKELVETATVRQFFSAPTTSASTTYIDKNVMTWTCVIAKCGYQVSRTVKGEKTPAPISNMIRHVRTCAMQCDAHAKALALIDAKSATRVQVGGEMVTVESFREAFPHHLRYVECVAQGMAACYKDKPTFRAYVRGRAPRASFPHHITIHRIAECYADALRARQLADIKATCASFKGGMCYGIQLDMWSDGATHSCFACINITSVRDPPASGLDTPQLLVRSEVLDFETFPHSAHTGDNIAKWFKSRLKRAGLDYTCISGVSPDGAADGQKAMASILEIAPLVDTCTLHQLQRATLYALGIAGVQSKNDRLRLHLRKHRRIVQLSNQSRAVTEGIRKAQEKFDIPPPKVTP
jgi:hypothetical protein